MGGVRHLHRARSVVKLENPLHVCVRLTCSEPSAAAPGCQSDRTIRDADIKAAEKARSQPCTTDSSARLPPIHALISYLFFFFTPLFFPSLCSVFLWTLCGLSLPSVMFLFSLISCLLVHSVRSPTLGSGQITFSSTNPRPRLSHPLFAVDAAKNMKKLFQLALVSNIPKWDAGRFSRLHYGWCCVPLGHVIKNVLNLATICYRSALFMFPLKDPLTHFWQIPVCLIRLWNQS